MLAAALTFALQQTAWPTTQAERTHFAETSTYAHVVDFLDQLQKVAPVQVQYIGSSQGGRRMPMAVASIPQVSTPLEAKRLGRPIVYIQANIHGGEVEGKEAAQALLRDLYREDSELLKKLVLVVVPIYNIDGNERWGDGRINRRGQTGPATVGQRTNDAELDLNRDCMKAESPEMRAVLSGVYNAWDPDVVFDLHTTNGTRHGYGLTYSPPLHPNTHPGVLEYSRGDLIPRVRARMQSLGIETFDYGNTGARQGATVWSTFGYEGRYVTNYGGLRNRVSILSEAMSYNTFEDRVRHTYAFVKTCLEEIAKDSARILEMSRKADADMVAWAAEGKSLGVRFEMASRGSEDVLLERPPSEGEDPRVGPITAIDKARMAVFDRFTPTRTAWVPAAYVVPAGEVKAIELLLRHGVVVEVLREDLIADVAKFTVLEVVQARTAFQGHRLVRLEGSFRTEGANVPSGNYIVRTSQPLGVLVFEMLEPESLDGVAAWEFLSALPTVQSTFPVFKLRDASKAVTEVVGGVG
ncbi:MAG: M14 family zinc carboxypeptidase [Fimbriimonadaceae bacterium]